MSTPGDNLNASWLFERKKRTIHWPRTYGGVPSNGVFSLLTERESNFSLILDRLLKIGVSIPPTEEQMGYVRSLLSIKGIEDLHYFESLILLSDPFFLGQGKHAKRIWFILTLLGEENERPMGYTTTDLKKFSTMSDSNRTLVRVACDSLQRVGILKRTERRQSFPRFRYTGNYDYPPDIEYEVALKDMIFDLEEQVKAIKRVIGRKMEWKNQTGIRDRIGCDQGIVNTGFGKIIYSTGLEEWVPEFVDLWTEWFQILYSGIFQSEMPIAEAMKDRIDDPLLVKRIELLRNRVTQQECNHSAQGRLRRAYLLVDLGELLPVLSASMESNSIRENEKILSLLLNSSQVRYFCKQT